MEELKAISPEIRGLFETIKKQAVEYTEAFELLKKEAQELGRLKDEVHRMNRDVSVKTGEIFSEINNNMFETLNSIESKTEKTIKIYDDLENIRSLRDSLTILQETLRKHALELQTTIPNLRQRAEIEIESTLKEIRNRAEKELETEMQKMELRIALKLKNFEGKFLNFDQKLLAVNDSQVRATHRIEDELDIIKVKMNAVRVSVDEFQKQIEFSVKDFEMKAGARIEALEKTVDTEKSSDPDPSNSLLIKDFEDEDENLKRENELKKLRQSIAQVNELAYQASKKQNIAIIIAAIAIVAAVIAIILK